MNLTGNAGNKISNVDLLMVPSQDEWDKMSASEKCETEDRIIAALEHEFNLMGETTMHFQARASANEVLRRYYANRGKKVFIASDLHTLYPEERAFYPDLLVVFDVADHHRRSWNVLREKKGLDFVLEILSRSTRRTDQVEKLNLFARLGIPEYFMFDPEKYTLTGYTLENQIYHKIESENEKGIFSSVLGLYLIVDTYKLRFVVDGIDIPFGDELIQQLNHKLAGKDRAIAEAQLLVAEERKQMKQERKEKEQERAEKEQERAEKEQERVAKEQEKARADALEQELIRLKKQINDQL